MSKKEVYIKKLKSLDKDFKYYEFFNKILQNIDEYDEEFLSRAFGLLLILKNEIYDSLVSFDEYNNYAVVFKYLNKYNIFYIEDVLEGIYEDSNFSKFKKFANYLENETNNSLVKLDFKNAEIIEEFEYLNDAFEYVFQLEDDNIIHDLLFYELDLLERK